MSDDRPAEGGVGGSGGVPGEHGLDGRQLGGRGAPTRPAHDLDEADDNGDAQRFAEWLDSSA